MARSHCNGIGGTEKANLWTGESRAHLHQEIVATRNQPSAGYERGKQRQVELSREGDQRLGKRARTEHRKGGADVAQMVLFETACPTHEHARHLMADLEMKNEFRPSFRRPGPG